MSEKSCDPTESKTPTIQVHTLDSESDCGAESSSHTSTKRVYPCCSESNLADTTAQGLGHIEKRQCSGNQFLAASNLQPNKTSRHRKTNRPLPLSRENSIRPRSSRFLEGSMNDRVSQMPPLDYLGPQQDPPKYEKCQRGETAGGQCHYSTRSTCWCRNDITGSLVSSTKKPRSSIHKIGKSIAASLNISNWKIRNKAHESQESEIKAQNRLFNDRQAKAAKAYSELKKSGQLRDTAIRSDFRQTESEKTLLPSSAEKKLPDTAIDEKYPGLPEKEKEINSDRNFQTNFDDEEKIGQVRIFSQSSTTACNKNQISEFSDSAPTALPIPYCSSRSTIHTKTPLLSSLRKALNCTKNPSDKSDHVVRESPSHEDLLKHRKLVERVSDLEFQLEAARRQLKEAESIRELVQPRFPKRESSLFAPFPSLRSESCLARYKVPVDTENQIEGRENDQLNPKALPPAYGGNNPLIYDSSQIEARTLSSSYINKIFPHESSTSEESKTNTEEDASTLGTSVSHVTSVKVRDSSEYFDSDIDSQNTSREIDLNHNAPAKFPTQYNLSTENSVDAKYDKLYSNSELSLISSSSDGPPESSVTAYSCEELTSRQALRSEPLVLPEQKVTLQTDHVESFCENPASNRRCVSINRLYDNEIPQLRHPTQVRQSFPQPFGADFAEKDLIGRREILKRAEFHPFGYQINATHQVELNKIPKLSNTPKVIFVKTRKQAIPDKMNSRDISDAQRLVKEQALVEDDKENEDSTHKRER